MMDLNFFKLYINTLKYLKSIQIYYRILYLIKRKFIFYLNNFEYNHFIADLNWECSIFYNSSYSSSNNSFIFLNIEHQFLNQIDWNYSKHGKLWTYNLNYFDFLNQKDMSKELGLDLVHKYIKNDSTLKDGKEPYPISLRGINWIKFLSSNNIDEHEINQTLYNHYQILLNNLEYHLLGNHLLENGFSLLFGAYYFQNEKLLSKSKKILNDELNEQLLNDGAHFELSPMYHQIILGRLLDCIYLIENNSWKNDQFFIDFLRSKAQIMLSYLFSITYNNGNVPMVNDSTFDISPSSHNLFDYARKLDLKYNELSLLESGYRKVKKDNYELFIDVGNIGPDYQVGHSHADTFNFELHVNNKPIIVDRGISTYEINNVRHEERGTNSHNTVMVNKLNQSTVWGGFRVANRAKVVKPKSYENIFSGKHDGYFRLKGYHKRKFTYNENEILIEDSFSKKNNCVCEANFHFHDKVRILETKKRKIKISEGLILNFYSSDKIKIKISNYELAQGFNKTVKATKISVSFSQLLKTKISL
jgi:hypothetical protein